MSLYSLGKSIAGQVPGTSLDLVLSFMKQSLIKIYQQMDWSFQRGITYSNWLVPGNVAASNGGPTSQGTTTVTPYSNLVILDANATAAINSYTTLPGAVFLTQLQYRDPSYSIYNIVQVQLTGSIAYSTVSFAGSGQTPGVYSLPILDNGGSGSGGVVQVTVQSNGTVTQSPIVTAFGNSYTTPYITLNAGGTPATINLFQNILLTLDRPWMEPTQGAGQNYMIYAAYFVAPSKYFTKFIEIRDTIHSQPIDFWSMTQSELSERDPQRTCFADPDFCVPAGVDNRPGTATPGWPMFELWPQQLSYIPYSYSYRSLGPIPETQQDFFSFEPPFPISYELIEWRTRGLLYQYKEANKDATAARGSGSNWILLTQLAQREYDSVLDKIQAIDINLNNEAFSRTRQAGSGFSGRPFANRTGGVNVGSYGEDY